MQSRLTRRANRHGKTPANCEFRGCRTITLLAVGSLVVSVIVALTTPAAAQAKSDDDAWFADQVLPILERRCYGCHSHKSGKMQGGLTLDSRSGWVEGGDSGPAVVPRQPDNSLLIQAIRRTTLEMPPDEKLPDAELTTLIEWVRRGAPDPRQPVAESARLATTDWWSLRSLQRPPIPLPVAAAPGTTPLDRFLADRLAREGLAFSPPADRRTLLRRVMFDLQGLPPTPDEVDAFVGDDNPWAYEQLVDRLLASPRYGERWARHWFDTIHFAETHGYEHDVLRGNAWRYRDYVIDALNRDTEWPRFVREQLAADVFYPDQPQLTAALGFLGAGTFDLSTFSTAPVTFDYLDRDDMVTQTMASLASATANCARCHDHKFDPISQEDYYALQAVFAGVTKGDVTFDADPQVLRQRQYWQKLLTAADKRDAEVLLAAEHLPLVARWEQENAGAAAAWESLELLTLASSQGAQLRRTPAGAIASEGPRPERDTYTVTARSRLASITAIRLDVVSDDSLPMKGPGRQDNGNLHLNEIEILASGPASPTPQKLRIRRATADFDQEGWTIQHAVDGNPATAWGIYPKVGQSHLAVFELEPALEIRPDTTLTIALHQSHGGGHLIGRFQLAATSAHGAQAAVYPADVEAALRIEPSQRTPDQALGIAAHAARQRAEYELSRLPAAAKVYGAAATVERDNKVARLIEPKVVHVLKRGDIGKPGAVAQPGAISSLAQLPGRFPLADPRNEAARRAALADWLTHPDNPLTWRSIVNRVWHYHFGRGICDTPGDFGRMGGVPSHPELLDWLTSDFRDQQASLKRLHRGIVTSDAYRQASVTTIRHQRALDKDPDNRWLWRGTRQRLDAESYRDAVLAVSGRLDVTMGGPSIQHFKTSPGAQLTPKLDYDAYDWEGPGAGRRSIYRFVWRGIADPFMEALDFPDAALLQPTRGYSASALQALALYNNDFVLRHGEHFARRLEIGNGTADQRVRSATRLVWQREPSADETRAFVAYAEQHGWPALCRVLFNSSEFLFVE